MFCTKYKKRIKDLEETIEMMEKKGYVILKAGQSIKLNDHTITAGVQNVRIFLPLNK